VAYTQECCLALGTALARRIFARQGPEARALVLDCDSILSNLAEGEDGDGTGALGREIQEFALQQAERGMLLCLYTRRAEKDVARAFALHPEMPLQPAHIVAERLGQISAGTALRELAEEIQLDLDNFVFLTADRETYLEAQAQCPEARAILVPREAAKISDFLRHLWVFDA